jgi:hypothetical protein
MHDDREAGKYLFLSGQARPDETKLIDLFLTSIRQKTPNALIAQFPSAARCQYLEEYPESIRERLVAHGWPKGSSFSPATPKPTERKAEDVMACLLAFVLLGLIVIGLIVGVKSVIRWVSD